MTATELLATLSSAPKTLSGADVAQAFLELCEEHLATRQGVMMRGILGAPDWKGYEQAIWKLGETLRPWLKKRRDLHGRSVLIDALERVALDDRFGKGRQEIVLLLGEFGDDTTAAHLATLLADDEVVGHVVKALTRLAAPGYSQQIQAAAASSKLPWVRTAAKRYMEKIQHTARPD